MKRGGTLSKPTVAWVLSAFGLCHVLGCGAQNPAPKAADPLPASSTVEVQNVAGAPNHGPNETDVNPDRDPSKLLEAYDADHPKQSVPAAEPSRSGLTLEVFERGPDQPWLVHIVNRGQDPAELVADTRLLWFEVKLAGKKKPSLCRLPEPLAPGNQPEARLVVHLDPGEGVADQFDPRLYCFAEGEQKLLVPGAEITPHFGWPEAPPKKRWRKGKLVEEPVLQKPPFVARITQPTQTSETPHSSKLQPGVSPQAAARLNSAAVSDADKHLTGAPLTLKSEYAQWARPGSIPTPNEAAGQPPPAVGFRLIQGSDAKAEHEATVELTISNQSPLPVYVYFRRDMVTFEVIGPNGVSHCPGRLDERTPERSSYLHLNRGASNKYAVRLAELCPRGTFGIPGLYLVYARFDAMLDGTSQGINAFVGPVYSKTPATVRIRTGEQQIFRKRPMLRTESSVEGSAGSSEGKN